MSAIKTLFGVVVLVSIAGFLYVWINTDPDSAPPPGAPQAWNSPVTIELPGSGASSSPAFGGSSLSTAPPFAPQGAAPASVSPSPVNASGNPAASLLLPSSGVAATSAPASSVAAPPLAAPKLPTASPPPPVAVSIPSAASGATANSSTTLPTTPLAPPPVAIAQPTVPKQNLVLPPDPRRAESPRLDRTAATPVSTLGTSSDFDSFMRGVQDALVEDHLAQAHLRLSMRYRDPRLSPQQARRVQDLLDQLAGTVIYSQQSLLDPPYHVRPGDTLETIATQCNVSPQFLAKVNGLRDARDLQTGRELKVLRGPFDAVVRLESHELTLMLGGRYAGRFAIGLGKDCPIREGSYTVRSKTLQPAYYAPDNRAVEPGNPQNPLGQYLIGLDQQLSIHGTNDSAQIGQDGGSGCISLGERDIEDLYTILSVGSRVTIQR